MSEADLWNEADITINGIRLTTAQSMVVRVALGSFALSLRDENALGDDTHGRAMRNGYQGVLRSLLAYFSPGT